MRSPSPAFSFYPKDWLSDANVMAMSLEEQGAYVRLLAIYWLEGGLPSDLGRLARLVGIPLRRFERLWPAISACFQTTGDRLFQKRIETEKSKQLAFRERQSDKGRIGGKSSHINKNAKPRVSPGLTGSKPEVTLPSPSPFPSPEKVTDNGLPSATAAGVVVARPAPEWNREAAEDFTAVYGGPPPNQFFPQVQAVAKRYGWGRTRPVLREYMAETPLELLAIPKVLAVRVERVNSGKPARASPGKSTLGERVMAEAEKFIGQGGEG